MNLIVCLPLFIQLLWPKLIYNLDTLYLAWGGYLKLSFTIDNVIFIIFYFILSFLALDCMFASLYNKNINESSLIELMNKFFLFFKKHYLLFVVVFLLLKIICTLYKTYIVSYLELDNVNLFWFIYLIYLNIPFFIIVHLIISDIIIRFKSIWYNKPLKETSSYINRIYEILTWRYFIRSLLLGGLFFEAKALISESLYLNMTTLYAETPEEYVEEIKRNIPQIERYLSCYLDNALDHLNRQIFINVTNPSTNHTRKTPLSVSGMLGADPQRPTSEYGKFWKHFAVRYINNMDPNDPCSQRFANLIDMSNGMRERDRTTELTWFRLEISDRAYLNPRSPNYVSERQVTEVTKYLIRLGMTNYYLSREASESAILKLIDENNRTKSLRTAYNDIYNYKRHALYRNAPDNNVTL